MISSLPFSLTIQRGRSQEVRQDGTKATQASREYSAWASDISFSLNNYQLIHMHDGLASVPLSHTYEEIAERTCICVTPAHQDFKPDGWSCTFVSPPSHKRRFLSIRHIVCRLFEKYWTFDNLPTPKSIFLEYVPVSIHFNISSYYCHR